MSRMALATLEGNQELRIGGFSFKERTVTAIGEPTRDGFSRRRAIYALPRIKGQVIGGIALCKRTQRNRRSPCRVASLSAQVVRTTANTAAGPGR